MTDKKNVLEGIDIKVELATPVHKALLESARMRDFLKVPESLMLNSLIWVKLKDIIENPDWDQNVFDVLTSKGRMRVPTEEERHAYIHRAPSGFMVRKVYMQHALIVDDQFILTLYFHLKQPDGKKMVWVPELFNDTLPVKKKTRAEQEVSLDNVL